MIDFDFSGGNVSLLSASGTMWDIAGAWVVVQGMFFANDAQVAREAASTYGPNIARLRATAEERIATRFGFGLLLIGFLFQFVASFGVKAGFGVVGLAVVGLVVVFLMHRHDLPYRVALTTLRIGPRNVSQEVWRRHFADLPDLVWARAVWNSGATFERD